MYTAIKKDFANYIQRFDIDILDNTEIFSDINDIPQAVYNSIRNSSLIRADSYVSCTRIDAYDEDKAIFKVSQNLSSIRSLTFLSFHGIDCGWENEMYVSRLRSNRGMFLKNSYISFDRDSPYHLTTGRVARQLRTFSRRILTKFDGDSTERILSSANTSAHARSSTNPESQLISLWSAIEILLSEPSNKIPRIVHYADLLLPSICIGHIRRQAIALYDELLLSYRRKFSQIVMELPDARSMGDDPHSKFISTLLIEDNQEFRQRLFGLLGGNPLGRHRLWKFCGEYSSPEMIRKTISRHEEKVKWQLHRIYRARNHIVHAGRVPNFLDSLILNMFEYYRSVVVTIAKYASKDKILSDVDQIVAEIAISYQYKKKFFQSMAKDAQLDFQNLNLLAG